MRWATFVLVSLLGLAVRLPQLAHRPMHTDEAVNAYIVGELLAGKRFPYDASDRHGPGLALVALPLARVQGAKTFGELTETQLRLTPVIAGTMTLLLFGAAVELFGFAPCTIAALLFATASLPVYYDRYFIHESLFCCATFGLLLSGWLALQRRSITQAALAGACTALMLACKETAVLHFAAMAAAAVCLRLWTTPARQFWTPAWSRFVLTAAAAFLVLGVVLFTLFGRDWKALAALAHAAPAYLARAQGAGHEKVFGYYALLLAGNWSGRVLCLLACVGFVETVRRCEPSPLSFLALYSALIATIYSAIPYKTPWLALNLWLPLSLFAGVGIASLWRPLAPYRVAPIVGLGVTVFLAILIGRDTWRLVFQHPADEDNPYAYAHTSEDLLGLVPEIDRISRENGIAAPRIAVIARDPWPTPWYLRRYPQTGYWQTPESLAVADFYLTSTDAAAQAQVRLDGFRADFFGVRPGVLILLWSRTPE